MGIASLVAWLWMAVQCPNVWYEGVTNHPFCAHLELIRDEAPAEHIIEIRTKREDRGAVIDKRIEGLGGEPRCADPQDSLEYPVTCEHEVCISIYTPPRCVRVTREIWIDGKRWGVLRETGDK